MKPRPEYENDIPITCQWTILDLLYPRWGDGTVRELSRWPHAPNHVCVWTEGGDHGRGEGSTKRYLVDPKVVDTLLNVHLLEGKKEWGRTEMHELYISVHGRNALDIKWKEVGGADFYGHEKGGIPPASRWLRRRT